jgi:competence protein ComEC
MQKNREENVDTDHSELQGMRGVGKSKLLAAGALIGLLVHVAPAFAGDCIQPKSANGATFRQSPSGSASSIGQLSAGSTAPLIAIVPRWYETQDAFGQTAFVSKQSTNIVPCPSSSTLTSTAAQGFEIHSIDVGTGLAVLVLGPDFSLLFDAGTNDDLARGSDNRVLAYLHTLPSLPPRIDHVLLSHPHRDHVELLPDIFREFQIVQVWNSGAYNDICAYRHFLETIAMEPGVQYHTAKQDAGDEILEFSAKKCYGSDEPKHRITLRHDSRIDDGPIRLGESASMRILHADGSKRASFNENSLVVRLDLGPHRVLLTGDAEAGGRKLPAIAPAANSIEGKLLACCISELKADVLVVGHHGSKTSSRMAFLDAVGAKFYVISAGPTRYATVTLPDAEIVTELEGRGSVLRTDAEDGQCGLSPEKVGPDADGRPGGCDDVLLKLPMNGAISAEYRQVAD